MDVIIDRKNENKAREEDEDCHVKWLGAQNYWVRYKTICIEATIGEHYHNLQIGLPNANSRKSEIYVFLCDHDTTKYSDQGYR